MERDPSVAPPADVGDLVAAARAGGQEAWAALTERYTGLLWSVARGMRLSQADAADAVQTTWLRLVEHLDTVREPAHLGSWLATTLRRECLLVLKAGERTRPAPADWNDQPDMRADQPGDALLRRERNAALRQALASLGERCQLLLRVLLATPPPSYAEVAAALDLPIGSIGPTRRRCLDQLRVALGSTPG